MELNLASLTTGTATFSGSAAEADAPAALPATGGDNSTGLLALGFAAVGLLILSLGLALRKQIRTYVP